MNCRENWGKKKWDFFSKKIMKGGYQMKNDFYKNYDELPLMLSVSLVAKVLGISRTSTYDLVKEKDFPSITIGTRIIVPKDELILWIKNQIKNKEV